MPLADRPARLTFEVDNHEIGAREQHLAEMIIAVAADARGDDAALHHGSEVLQHFGLAGHDRFGLTLDVVSEIAETAAEHRQRARSAICRIV